MCVCVHVTRHSRVHGCHVDCAEQCGGSAGMASAGPSAGLSPMELVHAFSCGTAVQDALSFNNANGERVYL